MNYQGAKLAAWILLAIVSGASLASAADGWMPRPFKKGSPTRRVLSKTQDALTPWDNDKKKNEFLDGNRRFFRPDLVAAEKRNAPVWYRPGTWFREDPKPQNPATVSDWIGLERPGFGSP